MRKIAVTDAQRRAKLENEARRREKTYAAKTTAERVAEHRARKQDDGLVRVEIWVHPKDVTRLKKEADALAARRAGTL